MWPLLLLASLVALVGAEPVQLISGSGDFAAPVASSVASSLPGGSGVSVVASLGGNARGRRLLNAVFGTSFATELQLDGADEGSAGAWLAASPSTGALVLDTQALDAIGEARSSADACKLASFSLALADAVIVHSPCVAPSAALVKDEFERIFSHHLTAGGGDSGATTLLVHVGEPAATGGLSSSALTRACKEAWESASSFTELRGKPFEDVFELELVELPASSSAAPEAFEEGVAAIRSRLSGLSAGKVAKPGAFAEAAASAWQVAGAATDGQPTEDWLRERYLAARSYESAYGEAQATLRQWAPVVAKGKLVRGFGSAAATTMSGALASFDAGISSCSAASAAMLAQRRARLAKALQNDVSELFSKQHRQLTVSTIGRLKSQLLRVQSRGGSVAEWQQESLRRNAEKHFDAAVSQLMVAGIGEATRAQLTTQFGKQLTEVTQKFLESPAMQLQAIAAMRRRTGKGQKPPRGIRAGLGLTGAIRSAFGGGQGNIQTYAGYTEGLNSAHIMFANDGLIADSSGQEPPFWRWQPKMNFDIST